MREPAVAACSNPKNANEEAYTKNLMKSWQITLVLTIRLKKQKEPKNVQS